MPYVTLVTLGCPKNQVDSEHLLRALKREGIDNTDSVQDAGIILVNTCGFINDAKEESINEVINLARYKGANKKLVVFGCLSQRYKDELITELPEIDAIWGVGKENEIVQYCKDTLDPGNVVNVSDSPVQVAVDGATPMYAYIKIAEGCNRPCGYCVIPSIRGGFRSFPAEAVMAEAEACVKAGKKELILIAQDLTSYGKDIGYDLPRIIKDIASISGDFWIRLLYLYPTALSDALLEVVSGQDKVCKYLDIPLQHSEDKVLRAMGRGGSRKYYAELARRLRRDIPDVTLRTTFIVGYPGETHVEFSSLKAFVAEVGFDCLGVFAYSDEEGTTAYNLVGKVSERVKKKRLQELMSIQEQISYERNTRYVGRRFRAIIDDTSEDLTIARLYCHAPEIDGSVVIRGQSVLKRDDFVDVEITAALQYDLVGCLA
ncbi:SSU ribosomal protein S12P methylthiotransferase [Candidatus Magnetobacterium bavaricum]|uniref:Ribosomal protein uS12 methylthiotransferase RimO n=1 Tax=Candidatus Magnetobacterium bavaricum TaxID=29290 RepID=A0A0F3GP07_9BACT|nr:SSU ribosomal protein S12P methylthiotransferase [Candidatus Magnetobacterium bavaricum]